VTNLIVVDNLKTWPLKIPDVPIVAGRDYLTEREYSERRNLKVFNLCRSYRYQNTGYYVSLLAMARGHKVFPSITTIQDMKTVSIVRIVAEDLDDVIQRNLRPVKTPRFTLSVYFGLNLAKRYDELALRLFRLFQAPLLRAEFVLEEGVWKVDNVGPIAANEIPDAHQDFVVEAAQQFFAQGRLPRLRRATTQYDLAILFDPSAERPPSNRRALGRFAQAGKRARLSVELIKREDFGRLAEFDALFIRETTSVNHHTYRFARRAAAEGLVVIDDPESIAKCSNKVYVAELMARHDIPTPKTMIVHRDNRDQVRNVIGLPCVLKEPDSSFSQGVFRTEEQNHLDAAVERLLDKSDLVIAQEFVPTPYDWRICVLENEPLFACRYYMARGHWQIVQSGPEHDSYGNVEPVPLDLVPRPVLSTAVRAARLIGDGLYGVDVKQFGKKAYLMEINDNPNIDAGYDDLLLGDALYDRIMRVFLARIQRKKNAGAAVGGT
jgi:glutathione synthase/RimK-type ligase-like ATP-grasp enzyme